ncbi:MULTISPECIES: hypothetical protein [Streptomyces]|uniref:hypothetical protein n=1 Tax=Streptomyces TaxID=1883 RepID=UPI0036523638
MAIYRPGEVNCGNCNEPTGIPADDWDEEQAGPLTFGENGYVSGGICAPCHVHDIGDWDASECGCVDCEENECDDN